MEAIWKTVLTPASCGTRPKGLPLSLLAGVALVCLIACHNDIDPQRVSPRQLRDVPAQRLAYSFHPDIDAPPGANPDNPNATLKGIQDDFDTRRKDEALLRTIPSPAGEPAHARASAA